MIRINDLRKVYRTEEVETIALDNMSLHVKEHEFVAIMGPSGCGKSTLLNILGLLDDPDSGSYLFNGVEVTGLSEDKRCDLRRENIGFVFQFHHLLPEFTALENVCMPAWIKGVPRKEAEKKALGLLELMGLQDRISHKPSELSGGEQQRVSVARALINSPKVVLADEPSGNLDTHTKNELHQLFFSLRDELGQTFVIVTHDTELAEMADSKICLSDGQIKG